LTRSAVRASSSLSPARGKGQRNKAQRLIGAVEAGGTKFVAALAREDGTVLDQARVPTGTPDTCLPLLLAFFRQAAASHGVLAAFGIASFGPIDSDPLSPGYGTITTTPKPGWSGFRYPDALAEFGVPVTVDTDVNGAALGEWRDGAGRGCTALAYTTVGTGIGTGVVRNGVPLRGFSHYESGHIPVARDPLLPDAYPGLCPFHGDCLEGLASGPAIAARWGEDLSGTDVPMERVETVAGYLAQLATNLVLLHMPDRLVFGGGVMKSPGLIEALRRKTEQRLAGYIVAPQLDPGLSGYIVPPALGDNAGIAGAIALGLRALT